MPGWMGPRGKFRTGLVGVLAPQTRQLERIHGLDPRLRPLRPVRTAVRRAMLRMHNPAGKPEAFEGTINTAFGIQIHVNTYELVQRDVFLVGHEPEVTALIRRLLRPESDAVDVGANAGVHTLMMAQCASRGRVLACEPNPGTAEELRANVRLNGVTNIVVREAALGETRGRAMLHVPDDTRHQGGASLQSGVHTFVEVGRSHPVEVDQLTLDELAAEAGMGPVKLIKIDVEGREASVLRGARKILARDHPALICEYTADWWAAAGETLEDVIALLTSWGYASFEHISWRGLRPLSQPFPSRANLLVT